MEGAVLMPPEVARDVVDAEGSGRKGLKKLGGEEVGREDESVVAVSVGSSMDSEVVVVVLWLWAMTFGLYLRSSVSV